MCVGTSTAIAIGVGAASSIAAAKMQSGAAKDAAKTQADSGRQALDVQQQQYQQARQDFSPYQQAGSAAVGRLGGMATAPTPQFNAGQPQAFASLGNPMGSQAPVSRPMGGSPVGLSGNPGNPGNPTPQMPQQGDSVLMRAPDGSTRPVPRALVQQFMARGAQVVG